MGSFIKLQIQLLFISSLLLAISCIKQDTKVIPEGAISENETSHTKAVDQ